MKKLALIGAMMVSSYMLAFAADEPTYPGGKEAMDKFIAETMVYPVTAIENGVEGVVNVHFQVLQNGNLDDIKIVRMVDPDLEQEAIRIVKKMPAWIPADKDGQPVDGAAEIAIVFELPGE